MKNGRLINKTALWLLIVLFAIIGVSCKKKEGKGGKLSIKGKVYANYYNKSYTKKRGEGYIPDKDVFILYGDEDIIGDDVKTNYEGAYEFEYLNKGKYKIYVYSTDLTTQLKTAVVKEITLTDDVVLEDIIINDDDKTEGAFAIRGKLLVHDFDDTFSTLEGSYYGMDEDVYIVEEGDSSATDRVWTNYNGMYEFTGLRPGKYKIYVYSETQQQPPVLSGMIPVVKEVEIINGDLMLSDFVVSRN